MGSIPAAEHHDILIVGAGLTGINTAHLLRTHLPHRTFSLLECRPIIGGTWSFFNYPGFRSDSSMSTFGLQWHAWPHESKVGRGEQIARYLESAVDSEEGLRGKIRLGHRVVSMSWEDDRATWRLEVEKREVKDGKFVEKDEVEKVVMEANFVIGATGYYDYEKPMEADIPGLKSFKGQIVHPQFWPEDFDTKDKRIAIIGSGATTVTLLPQFVNDAKKVTIVQRSPSYVANIPTRIWWEEILKMFLPLIFVHWLAWWKDTLFELVLSLVVLRFPSVARWALRREMKAMLPKGMDVDKHFNPRYPPMLQRLCLTPDEEFFKCFERDNVGIVTDTIEAVTEDGIIMMGGEEVKADVIITATGLRLHLFGGITPTVNGMPIHPGQHFGWRGCMLEGLPNQAFILGYVTTTWTPGSDQMAKIIIKLLRHMEKKGVQVAVPKMTPEEKESASRDSKLAVNITSGYIVKAADRIPKVTGQGVWYGRDNLAKDTWALWFGNMDEGMEFKGDKKGQ